ncbi:MAG: hypothetical protein A2Y24_03385 [Clostridiales bacterium GWE2_32_10]|nr:MAG: hypothetical protein A2Y24_03385 [Clostridiales bacterium GWE2_32_10]
MHFGNVEGYNKLEGKDVGIIGTPHLNEIVYRMWNVALGGEDKAQEMKYQEIEKNNYRFWFMTYSDENLQEIQIWFIESELEQAVGRSRLLRNDCTAFLFSNFPLPQAEFVEIDDKDDEIKEENQE